MPGIFGQGQTVGQGSKRDGAPQAANPAYNPNMNAPANFWKGNQLQIPGAMNLGTGTVQAPMPGPAPQQAKPNGLQGLLAGILGGGGAQGMGGLAGLLGGAQPPAAQMPGSGSATLPQGPAGGGQQQMNPGIAQLLQMLQQRQP